jgi:NADH-quinone oxidoreductase subunit N
MTTGAFGIVLLLSRKGFEAEALDDYKGLNRRSPWSAFVMLLLMFGMAGVPPTVGFWAKVQVISAVLDIGLAWLAALAVLLSVIGAYYYLRIVKLMYFDEPTASDPLVANSAFRFVLGLNGLAVLALGLFPGMLLALCAYVLP